MVNVIKIKLMIDNFKLRITNYSFLLFPFSPFVIPNEVRNLC